MDAQSSSLSIEIVDNHTTSKLSNLLFPRRVLKRHHTNNNLISYELELYDQESVEELKTNIENDAQNYFSIQPSSTTSERAFSRAGFTITNNWANLNKKTVACLILIHSWLVESQKEFIPLKDLPGIT
ncbi:4738_t:CDS:2 [Dentiscutata erythropus]|uniref:4738_t:CDS:1 n=1 Tax=Dentiscutata erythropus TaxID=1348616 RepID=A0A9N9CKE9_9GLOM|nr:4738_t:CDS:2 [Dentiscutata erythropus]